MPVSNESIVAAHNIYAASVYAATANAADAYEHARVERDKTIAAAKKIALDAYRSAVKDADEAYDAAIHDATAAYDAAVLS